MSIPGDPSKQPDICRNPVFTPFSEENPKDIWDNGTGRWSQCPNIKEVGGGFDGERYRCDVCGKSYFLDYEDMK